MLSLAYLYHEVEELLADTSSSVREVAYKKMRGKLAENEDDPDFMWRMARVTHLYVEALVRKGHPKRYRDLQFEAKDYALTALQLQPEDADIRKWCALTIGGTTRFVGSGEKIKIGYQYKLHIEKAIELRPRDPRLRHLKGRFCYEIATLTWIERKLAAIFYEEPPTSTFEDAIEEFFEAERLDPRGSVDNLLQIARCQFHLGRKDRGLEYLRLAHTVHPTTPEDFTALDEVHALLAKQS